MNAGLVTWSRMRSSAQYWFSSSRWIHAGLVGWPALSGCGSMCFAGAKHWLSTPMTGACGEMACVAGFAANANGAASTVVADTAARIPRHLVSRMHRAFDAPAAWSSSPGGDIPPSRAAIVTLPTAPGLRECIGLVTGERWDERGQAGQ